MPSLRVVTEAMEAIISTIGTTETVADIPTAAVEAVGSMMTLNLIDDLF